MIEVSLSGSDLFDLAAGLTFETRAKEGHLVILDGYRLDDEQVAALSRGQEVDVTDGVLVYRLSAGEPPSGSHWDSRRLDDLLAGRYGPRLQRLHVLMSLDEPERLPLGPRSRPSGLAASRLHSPC